MQIVVQMLPGYSAPAIVGPIMIVSREMVVDVLPGRYSVSVEIFGE